MSSSKEYFKDFYIKNKERILENAKNRRRSLQQWEKTYFNIKARCRPSSKKSRYNGIKCFITKEELKELWFRDKAFNMSKPSIDRINPRLDYTFNNCRYIEHSDNSRRAWGDRKYCSKGHEYTKENTYIKPNNERVCRICKNNQQRISRGKLAI